MSIKYYPASHRCRVKAILEIIPILGNLLALRPTVGAFSYRETDAFETRHPISKLSILL